MSTKTIKTMANLQEIWKEIPNCPNYFISSHGRIKSTKYKQERLLSTCFMRTPYKAATLRVNNKSITIRIHRIVAYLFVENPNNRSVVNHKDGNKQNNNFQNLEWCTNSENLSHARDMGLNPQNIPVLNLETGIFYEMAKDAAKAHNITPSYLYNMLSGFNRNRTSLISVK